ncbi:cell division topological specificity factor MinE [Gammaproteobacteria bacterium SCGC AG-212-F23]|nr:cell division topological specificity factor MinE [Gammaproteobacteria bacterium SCGC AG-212-F23]
MSLLNKLEKIVHYFQPPQKTARVAKERLQIIIAHERQRDNPDYLTLMQKELLEVISKYVQINKDDIKIELDRKDGCSILELNIVLPASGVVA